MKVLDIGCGWGSFAKYAADLRNKIMGHPKFWRNLIAQFIFERMRGLVNFQTKNRAYIVGKKHYDIGNDLYKVMLDKRLTYTCGYWGNGIQNLNDAQDAKLEMACQKLQLEPGMKVLDIGCGWGSFAKYAAEKHQVSIVGVTISEQQIELARSLCKGLPIELHLIDYRDLPYGAQKFDRVVSLGMFEHVGYKNYEKYMKISSQCLNDEGIFLLHTIGCDQSSACTSEWFNTYIFPNGQIPSGKQITASCEKTFVMEDWHNFGAHYDTTLMAWHANFNNHWDDLKKNYDERFRRMWNYYLLSCAGSFRARHLQLWQIVLSKNGIMEGYERPVAPEMAKTNATIPVFAQIPSSLS
jgi:cyclopropane-fatty-acyl-phospholipid synthase